MSAGGSGWARVKDELLAVLELSPAAGRDKLRELASTDPELAKEVAVLVAAADESAPFLAVPALERASAAGLPAADAPQRVGPWLLEVEIGRGGMGTVWRAHRDDGAFDQTVAIKFVRPELATELLRRRLEAERRILAALRASRGFAANGISLPLPVTCPACRWSPARRWPCPYPRTVRQSSD